MDSFPQGRLLKRGERWGKSKRNLDRQRGKRKVMAGSKKKFPSREIFESLCRWGSGLVFQCGGAEIRSYRKNKLNEKATQLCNVKCEVGLGISCNRQSVWIFEDCLMTILAILFSLSFGPAMDIIVDFLIRSIKIHYVATCMREGSLFLTCSPLSGTRTRA